MDGVRQVDIERVGRDGPLTDLEDAGRHLGRKGCRASPVADGFEARLERDG
jgi:hypothetical protein